MVASAYPPVTAATIEEVRQQRRTMEANPELLTPPVDLNLPQRFIFRTQPGTVRQVVHDIPQPPMAGLDEKKDKFLRREWERRMLRQFRDPKNPNEKDAEIVKRAEAHYAAVIEHNDPPGEAKIRFSRVSKRNECYFSTDDPVLAAYLRDLVKRGVGEFQHVYEQNGRARIVVGPETAQVKSFPNTDSGRRAAFAYASEHGIGDIKMVED